MNIASNSILVRLSCCNKNAIDCVATIYLSNKHLFNHY